ncbi:ATP-binding protein [Dysgonomonas massiliensis]|uniref:ATP-binding protein n=1 Tax=Dysgonomonas massiliensis TaxID=2040292 RepID=UPI000C765CB0|nr:ATP-binding protein [Dysgonomonas massiliensis]
MKEDTVIQGTLFEDDYLIRSLGGIANQTDIALTELVANAWDAGATNVSIFIPDKKGDKLIVKDNGIGLTSEQFHKRWMKLRYNRLKHQGKNVIFPDGKKRNRIAYGRNGVGRHSLLCFNDEYTVKTARDGSLFEAVISTLVEGEALAIVSENISPSTEQGTTLEVVVDRNLPTVDKIREIISSRFLLDPEFNIEINRERLPLEDLDGLLDTSNLISKDGIELTAYFIDSKKTARKSVFQGIAFWQRGRLVGNPSWILSDKLYIDGRTSIAKRYSVIIKSDNLEEVIKEDWSGFKNDIRVENLYTVVAEYVNSMFDSVAKSTIEETKTFIKQELKGKLKEASPLTLLEIDEVIESITINTPTAKQDSITIAVEAIINLEKSKNGQELLAKLSKLNEEDIAGLNQILDKWTVKDALTVLSEIDRRISIIEAIRKLSSDKTIDELHVLHPLITESRWLFGPEYDTAEYTSNKQMQTVIKTLFKDKINPNVNINYKKRPDVVVLADNTTLSATGIEEHAYDSNLVEVKRLLIVELKRGGFEIKRAERDQANAYVEDLFAHMKDATSIVAYVVGDSIASNIQPVSTVGDENKGRIFVTTFSQLVDTAEKRMFRLREKLSGMYDDIPGMELYRQTQITFK